MLKSTEIRRWLWSKQTIALLFCSQQSHLWWLFQGRYSQYSDCISSTICFPGHNKETLSLKLNEILKENMIKTDSLHKRVKKLQHEHKALKVVNTKQNEQLKRPNMELNDTTSSIKAHRATLQERQRRCKLKFEWLYKTIGRIYEWCWIFIGRHRKTQIRDSWSEITTLNKSSKDILSSLKTEATSNIRLSISKVKYKLSLVNNWRLFHFFK